MGNQTSTNRLDQFQEQRELGRGGFGVVKLVTDRKSGTPFALKIVPYGFDTPATESLALREAATLQSLNHPNIVRLHHFWNQPGVLWGGQMYILMEYCQGGSLRQLCVKRRAQGKPFSVNEICDIMSQILNAVKFVHSKNIVHRDVKMDNVLINEHGQMKLGDFGVAFLQYEYKASIRSKPGTSRNQAQSRLDNSKTEHHSPKTLLGTPCYIAPEMTLEKPYSSAVDVYALGCMLEELVTMRFLYEKPTPILLWIEFFFAEALVGSLTGLLLQWIYIPINPWFCVCSSMLACSTWILPHACLWELSKYMRTLQAKERPTAGAVRKHIALIQAWPRMALMNAAGVLAIGFISFFLFE